MKLPESVARPDVKLKIFIPARVMYLDNNSFPDTDITRRLMDIVDAANSIGNRNYHFAKRNKILT